jgi:hypothetical protein
VALDVSLTDMQIFVFTSVVAKIIGFTLDRTGKSLPAGFAPWRKLGCTETMATAVTDPVARAIRRDGYFLVSSGDIRQAAGQRFGESRPRTCTRCLWLDVSAEPLAEGRFRRMQRTTIAASSPPRVPIRRRGFAARGEKLLGGELGVR